jgi:plastocyanin
MKHLARAWATIAAIALASTTLVVAAPAPAATKTLSGTVGPGFTISLKYKGKKVSSLKAGRYRIRVSDRSDFHNFHIRGPGVNRVVTGVDFEGTKSRTFRLRKGTYRYVCDPHSDDMKGSFRVR